MKKICVGFVIEEISEFKMLHISRVMTQMIQEFRGVRRVITSHKRDDTFVGF